MKRSEMVESIRTFINSIYTVQNVDSLEEDELAEWFLDCIEKAGMLPPDNGKEAYDIIDYRSKCLRWEPEDGE